MSCAFKDLKCNFQNSGFHYDGLVIWIGIIFGIVTFLYMVFALVNCSGKFPKVCFCICRPRNESVKTNIAGFVVLLLLIIAQVTIILVKLPDLT